MPGHAAVASGVAKNADPKNAAKNPTRNVVRTTVAIVAGNPKKDFTNTRKGLTKDTTSVKAGQRNTKIGIIDRTITKSTTTKSTTKMTGKKTKIRTNDDQYRSPAFYGLRSRVG